MNDRTASIAAEIEGLLDAADYSVLEPWRADVVHLIAGWASVRFEQVARDAHRFAGEGI